MAAGSGRGTAWQDGAPRALEYAIAASLALHGLALLSFPLLPSLSMQPPPLEPPLEARLMPARPAQPAQPIVPVPPPPVVEPAPPPPKPPPIPRRVVKKTAPPSKRVHRSAPKRVQEPVRQPVLEAAPTPAPVPPAPNPVVAAPPPAPVVATPAPGAVPAARAAPPPDTASLVARYRTDIISQAKRFKRYPRFARDNGWEGTVDVRMEIGADGSIASLRVARGSGYSILDQQALDMVRRAKPDVTIPDGLRGTAFGIEVPVIFSLRDADG